ESLQDVALDRIRIPVLMVHHRDDACRVSRYADTSWAMRRLSAAPKRELLTFSGGDAPQSEACEPLAPHGYFGIEERVIDAITAVRDERVNDIATKFNASQNDYEVKAVYKGSYPDTLNAAIAAYRAKQPPHIVQVYEVGTQTMLSSGAVYPVFQLVKDHGVT